MSRDICQPAKMQAEIFFCLPHDPTPSKGLAWLSSCPSLFPFIQQEFSECPLRSDTWDTWTKGRECFHLVKIEVCGISVKQGGGWETLQESQKGLQNGWWSWKDGVSKWQWLEHPFVAVEHVSVSHNQHLGTGCRQEGRHSCVSGTVK